MSTEKLIEIRDSRRRQMYRIDDEYLNGYARLCGIAATAVYNSLCRHADTNQESFPSLERIMDQHGMSKSSVLRAIKALEKWNIITVLRRKNEKTKRQMVNIYVLVDQSQWNVVRVSGENPEPSVTTEPGPGVKNDKKPGVTREPEGNTEEKEAQREGSVAQSATAPACAKEECKEKPMKGVFFCEQHQPMQCFQFVEWYRRSEQRHIKIIAEWADELRLSGRAPELRTVAQWRAWAKPILNAAKNISVFDDDQIAVAMKRMMAADYITDFNLYTLKTFLINTKK
jgi:hypothetical protein